MDSATEEMLRLRMGRAVCGDAYSGVEELVDLALQGSAMFNLFLGDDGSVRGVKLASGGRFWCWGDATLEPTPNEKPIGVAKSFVRLILVVG